MKYCGMIRKVLHFVMGIVVILFCSSCTEEDLSTPEKFSKHVFEAIKNNDLDQFKSYLLSEEDWYTYRKTLKETHPDYWKRMKKLNEDFPQFLQTSAPYALKKLRSEGEKASINWKKTEFVRVEYKIVEPYGFQKADIYVYFQQDDKEHQLKLDDCGYITDHWFMGDMPRFIE